MIMIVDLAGVPGDFPANILTGQENAYAKSKIQKANSLINKVHNGYFRSVARRKVRKHKKTLNAKKKEKKRIVMIGASSLTEWDHAKSAFKGYDLINLAVAGSKSKDWQHCWKIATMFKPDAIIICSGANDIERGASADKTAEINKKIIKKIRSERPGVKIFYIGIYPCRSRIRFHAIGKMKKVESQMKKFCKKTKNVTYLDVGSSMSHPDGKPLTKKMFRDSCHPTQKTYDTIWVEKVAKPVIESLSS